MKKRWVSLMLLGVLLLGGLLSVPAMGESAWPAGDPAEVAVVLLHTNDVHVAFDTNIGYDGLALYKKELEALYDHVLLIDAGDAIQGASLGAISRGLEPIRMMNHVGYDLAVPGNHEFDFGAEALDRCANALDCGYTCANYCTSDGEPVYSPWRILEAGDLKLGFVGTVTPDAFSKSAIKDVLNEVGEPMYDFLSDDTGDRLKERLQRSIDEVREAGADYVFLISHLGNSDSISERYRCDRVVAGLSGLDAVIDGHSHDFINRTEPDKTGRLIPFVQAGIQLKVIGQLTIYRDGRMEEKLVDTVPEPENLPFERVQRGKVQRCVDPETKAFLEGIVASYAPVMERRIGEVSYDMLVREPGGYEVARAEECGLCDLVADAFRTIGGTEIGLLNAGSARTNLEAGEITYNDMLNVLPFFNEVSTAKVTGRILLDALEYGVSRVPNISGSFPQVSGISFHVDRDLPTSVQLNDKGLFLSVTGWYRVFDVTVNGEPLDLDREYTLTCPTFLLNGGSGYAMFKEADVLSILPNPDNEVVIRYIEENLNGVIPEIYRGTQGRILYD